ncbi:hypothetical protein K493DRAFT_319793 [Basidiobolus meristosporus CBS 931.73]|uniref:Inhibitor I9 domain-containing protein n=1 Tax=Basidiobolus meristosporus CBS 931.73 TaxID=1314790 RepID=A0A1Y1XL49_9FUNG|nr:hypothetical protein K493DRAFT_319793 [Basidiobolus meristosporus CBS 931.73]|eukprot:ORX86489.1 hypothetical protein K493DRAFT_319793 [Basidiobolus meristosporus CBS 931.73]
MKLLAILLSLLLILHVVGAYDQKRFSRNARYSEYIIEIEDDAPDDYEQYLEDTIVDYGGYVKFRYGTVYRGFSAFLPRTLTERFSRDPYIFRISPVKCMHTMTGAEASRKTTYLGDGIYSIRYA